MSSAIEEGVKSKTLYAINDKCGRLHVVEANEFSQKEDGFVWFFNALKFVAVFHQPSSIEFYTGQIPPNMNL